MGKNRNLERNPEKRRREKGRKIINLEENFGKGKENILNSVAMWKTHQKIGIKRDGRTCGSY